jgi:plasmid stabilization system protein ParE
MNVRYTEVALDEIEEILAYIAKDNATAAHKVSATIRATINRIADFPETGVETDAPGIRVAPVLPYRYLVFFGISDGSIVIRNVRHSARRQLVFPNS